MASTIESLSTANNVIYNNDRFWKRYGRCYDLIYNFMSYRKLLWDLYNSLEVRKGYKILNAGCGVGNFEKFIYEKKCGYLEIESIDLSEQLIKIAQKKHADLPNVNFQSVKYGKKLNFPEKYFDQIICNNAPFLLGNVRNPRFKFNELIRFLKPGGKLILVTPTNNNFSLFLATRNHIKKTKRVWKIHRKIELIFKVIKASSMIKILQITHSINRRNINYKNKTGNLSARKLIDLIDQMHLLNSKIQLSNSGQMWIATGYIKSIDSESKQLYSEIPEVIFNEKKKNRINKKIKKGIIKVRTALEADISDIYDVEVDAWGVNEAATFEQIKSRIEIFPEGNIVALIDNQIIGYASFILIHYDKYLRLGQNTWYHLTDYGYTSNHDPQGKNLFGISLSASNSAPFKASMPLLVEVIKRGIQHGVASYILGSRVPNYHKYCKDMDINEYVFKNTSNGKPIDPELRFYVDVGMKRTDIVKDYFSDDLSLNYGVIMKKDNPFNKNPLLNYLAKGVSYIPYDFAKLVDRVRN